MVKITRVYTKTGDKGATSASHNVRLSKHSARIAAIGSIDELNSFLGFALVAINKNIKLKISTQQLFRIQNELFDYGAMLSETKQSRLKEMLQHFPRYTQRLEKEMDGMNKKLPALTSFLLPGSNEIAARLHLARSVCRRAEQTIVALHEEEIMPEIMLSYINRLSDWLFVMARFVTQQSDEQEILWKPFNHSR